MRCFPASLLLVFRALYHGMVSEGLLSIHHGLQIQQIHCMVNAYICIKSPDDKAIYVCKKVIFIMLSHYLKTLNFAPFFVKTLAFTAKSSYFLFAFAVTFAVFLTRFFLFFFLFFLQ